MLKLSDISTGAVRGTNELGVEGLPGLDEITCTNTLL